MLKGYKHSKETRRKMSESHKGKNIGDKNSSKRPEVRQKISNTLRGKGHPFFGKHHSEKTKRKMSEARIKYFHQHPEARGIISKRMTGRKHSEKWMQKMKERIPWNKGKKGVQVAWNKGMKMSNEHCQKLSRAHKGQIGYWLGKKRLPVSEETRKKMSDYAKSMGTKPPSPLGRIASKEARQNMSNAQKGKLHINLRKEKNPNWQGGITPENSKIRNSIEFRLWREVVFARDNWVCQKCKERGNKLHSHHIQNFAQYPELRFAIDNGITLCKKCHIEFHKLYGKRNNTREQIKEFLSNKNQ